MPLINDNGHTGGGGARRARMGPAGLAPRKGPGAATQPRAGSRRLCLPCHGTVRGLLNACFVWPGIMIYKLKESGGAKRR